MDRRTSIKWMLAASAAVPLLETRSPASQPVPGLVPGYGQDPDLNRIHQVGELWPLSFTPLQRRTAAALCDVIIPADSTSPGASAVGVVDFIDEWVSAPYPRQRQDRSLILEGLGWLDAESQRRFGAPFAAADAAAHAALCDELCRTADVPPARAAAAAFFARFRDLTAGGFYSTPVGRSDLHYVGNVPLAAFDGPPPALLQKLGLDEEPLAGVRSPA